MNNLGIFNGLWGGISNTLGRGADAISERDGSADKKRAQEIALANLSLKALAQKAADNKTYLMIGGIIIMLIVLVIIKRKS